MIRIATVSYLNARPLTSRIDRERYELVQGHPSEIATLLREGAVDVALVPVAAALSDGDFRVLGELCIGAEGPVHSVLLVAESPPETWTEVVLDGVSRTSVTLARLLLRHSPLAARLRPDLVVRDGASGEGLRAAGGTVAGLVIGDAARDVPAALGVRIDLAEAWTAWTGLPFVFAVWAGRPDLPAEVRRHLIEAGRAGLAAREQDFSGEDLAYVTRSIRYTLDERALVGLRRYAALAARDGLIADEHLGFYDPPRRSLPRRDVDGLLVRASEGARLSREDLLLLAADAKLADLGAAARARAEAVSALPSVPWTPARRIVVTDVDITGAEGWRRPGAPDAILLTPDEVASLAAEASEVDAGEIQLVGGLHPGLGLAAWVRFVAAAASAGPAEVRALDLDGLRHLAALEDQDLGAILLALREAGWVGLADSRALVLDDAVRRRVAPDRATARVWLGLAEELGRHGVGLVGSLEFGAGETQDERIDHLLALRALHDRTGALQAFRLAPLREERGLEPAGATAQDHVRHVALARLALDAVAEHQAAWLHEAPGIAQVSLQSGASALGAVVLPVRADQEDNPYINPRAFAGARRPEDPWEVFCAEVDFHLARGGFVSDRRRPSRLPSPRRGSDPQPTAG